MIDEVKFDPVRDLQGNVIRGMKWYTSGKYSIGNCYYVYGGRVAIPCLYPAWLTDLAWNVLNIVNCAMKDDPEWNPPNRIPDGCVLNDYEKYSYMPWHADNEDIFNSKKCDGNTFLVSVSFYGARLFELASKYNVYRRFLKEGDIFLTYGQTQRLYHHQVTPSEWVPNLGLSEHEKYRLHDRRINATFRWFIDEPDMDICKAIAILS